MDIGYYNSYLEIDLEIIRQSISKVKQHIGKNVDIIPVVKGNAYGMGLVEMSRFLLKYCPDMLACGQVAEAVELRAAGIDCEILIMSGIPNHALDTAVELGLQIPVYNSETAIKVSEIAAKKNKQAKLHIKIDTGLNRIGVKPGKPLKELISCIKQLNNLVIDGVYTHFSNATVVNDGFTLVQLDSFKNALEQIKLENITPRFIHCRNTGAVSWLSESISTHVRVGTLLFGFPGMDDGSNLLGLGKEPESWRAFITNINELNTGDSCGYGHAFIADKPTRIATIDVGYGDGLFRPLVINKGPVLVGNIRTRYLSAAMDQTFIDVTDIPCCIGDEVTIFGYSKGGAALELAELEQVTGHTMTYLQSTLSKRVKRVYINQEENKYDRRML